MKSREKLRKWVSKACRGSGLNGLSRRLKTGAVALFYHGVTREILDPRVQGIHLPLSKFEKQVQYIRKNFKVISLDQLYECLSNGTKIDTSQVLLTFDDGYKSIIDLVAPYLKSYDLPFSIFVSTKHIETGQRFPTYYLRAAVFYSEKREIHVPGLEKKFFLGTADSRAAAHREIERFIKNAPHGDVSRVQEELIGLLPEQRWAEINERFFSDAPMNWIDLRELAGLGGTVGSHSHDHFIYHVGQNPQQAAEQLVKSRDLITEKVGSCRYFAYPEGKPRQIAADFIGLVMGSDYRLAFCTQEGEITHKANIYLLPRLGVPEDLDHFIFLINNTFLYNRRYRESIQGKTASRSRVLPQKY